MIRALLLLAFASVGESFVSHSGAVIKEKSRCITDGKCLSGVFPRLVKNGPSLAMKETEGAKMDRRSLISGMLLLTVPTRPAFSAETSTSSSIVVEGLMRLEQGSDKILQSAGGRAKATIYLRIVGRGIISKTNLDINLADFPPPGQPKPGDTSGVPFVVTEAQLNEKTEKGVTVNRALWADDDIFVRIDIEDVREGQVSCMGLNSSHR
jgi:hypothetical protein